MRLDDKNMTSKGITDDNPLSDDIKLFGGRMKKSAPCNFEENSNQFKIIWLH
jgi:hypothetical protein